MAMATTCGAVLTDGREGKLAMWRPADWYFWRSAAVRGVLELLNMLARFCRFMVCASLLLPCMLAKGEGRPGACSVASLIQHPIPLADAQFSKIDTTRMTCFSFQTGISSRA